MLKFSYHKYTLTPQTQLGAIASADAREGALLKVQWPDGKTGYADLFPWPELGDVDLETQLIAISRGRLSPLVEQAIWLARKDALLRAEGKNAFQGLQRVKNHFLVNDATRIDEFTLNELKGLGFTSIKVKIGKNLPAEAKFVEKVLKQYPHLMMRLDCNSSLDEPRFMKFLDAIPGPLRPRIEFVEDPFPFDPEAWRRVNELVPIALDQEYEKVPWDKMKSPLPFKVLIIKPARQDVKKATDHVNKFLLKMVITSSLDHPVGVAHAVLVASETKKFYPNVLLDCGCLSLRSYRATEFNAAMVVQGPYLIEVAGTGIGFDSIFGKIEWKPITPGK